ncbi:MAG: formylglycine-generating enzyme family protein [Spirochaetaceae bacterium]|jgi:formylglycine-generating enzyme required for sulfatase activity|nr:formylglycine-generating enzyme family protein [Spirochaetaceae bacterium]
MLKYSIILSISILQVAILLGTVAAPVFADEPTSFVLVPGGTFTLGSPPTEAGRKHDESQRTVTISAPFYMGQYEVTVGEFRRFVAETGYKTADHGIVWTGRNWEAVAEANWDNPHFAQNDDQPVVLVSWYDALAYANWLSAKEGLIPAYSIDGTKVSWNREANGYRLPTEAEWEYAARAGTTTAYSTGDTLTSDQAHFNSTRKPVTGTTAVGRFPPNSWGLYDMIGNAREWTWDGYGTYPSGDLVDPTGSLFSSFRVNRGGSWIDLINSVRSAHRFLSTPETRISSVGFRLVRPASPDAAAQRPAGTASDYSFAAQLSADETVHLDFATLDTYALVYVNIERDGFYQFTAKNTKGVDLDTYIAIYDADEYYRASDDDSGEGLDASLFIPLEAGEYGLVVVCFNEEEGTDSSFALSMNDMTDLIAGRAPELHAGENISKDFADANDFALIRLHIDSAGLYTISAKDIQDADFDTYIALYDINRTYLASDDDSGDAAAALLNVNLEPGEYLVFVGYVGTDHFEGGSCELSITGIKDQPPTETAPPSPDYRVQQLSVVPEEPLVLSFTDTDEYRIRLTIEQEAWYQVSAENLTGADFDADLVLLYNDEWSYTGDDGYLEVFLESGEYTVFFSYRGEEQVREDTAYLFYVSIEDEEEVSLDELISWSAEIAPGEPVELGFSSAEDEHYVRLFIDRKAVYEIRARNTQGVDLDTYIAVYDSEITLVGSDDDGGESLDAYLFVSLEPGEYGIRIICFNEEPLSDGSFELTVEAVSNSADDADDAYLWSAQIGPGEPVELSFADADTVHFVRLSLEHSAWYQISAKNMHGVDLDTYVELFTYDGTVTDGGFIDSDDDGGDGFDARLRLPLEPGDYVIFIECFDEDPLKDGSFVLLVEEISGVSAINDSLRAEGIRAEKIAVGETQERMLADETALDWVELHISETGRYRIRARNTHGIDLDTVLVLYDVMNTDNFLYNDDGGDSLDALLVADLDWGDYFIVVGCAEAAQDYSYTLSVELL